MKINENRLMDWDELEVDHSLSMNCLILVPKEIFYSYQSFDPFSNCNDSSISADLRIDFDND